MANALFLAQKIFVSSLYCLVGVFETDVQFNEENSIQVSANVLKLSLSNYLVYLDGERVNLKMTSTVSNQDFQRLQVINIRCTTHLTQA